MLIAVSIIFDRSNNLKNEKHQSKDYGTFEFK